MSFESSFLFFTVSTHRLMFTLCIKMLWVLFRLISAVIGCSWFSMFNIASGCLNLSRMFHVLQVV